MRNKNNLFPATQRKNNIPSDIKESSSLEEFKADFLHQALRNCTYKFVGWLLGFLVITLISFKLCWIYFYFFGFLQVL